MYILGTNDYLKVATRVDGVVQVPYRTGEPCLNALATLHFPDIRGAVEARVLLWAPLERQDMLKVEDGFTDREVVLEGLPKPSDSWYAKYPVGITAIWFEDPSRPVTGKSPAQVLRDIRFEEDPELLQFGTVPALVKTHWDR